MSGIVQLLLGLKKAGQIAGSLYMWGENPAGQLGNNSISGSSTATPTQALPTTASLYSTTIKAIIGLDTGAVIKSNGTLWTWGKNSNGQLGLNDVQPRSSPIQVGANTWTDVFVGINNAAIGVASNGAMYSWGANGDGQLGIGNIVDKSSPTQIGALTTWSKATIGNGSAAAIKTDGTLWTWGTNSFGNLGSNLSAAALPARSSPVQVGALTTWRQVSVGNTFMIGTKTDNTLWGWGRNDRGQLGQNNVIDRSSPVQVGALTTWSSVSAGETYWVAVKTDGTLWACGQNSNGQIGQNVGSATVQAYSSPVQIGALTNWSSVSAGYYGWVAIKTDWTAWGCGYNVYGQLGINTGIDKSSPVQIGRSRKWKLSGATSDQTILLTQGGELFTVGRAINGALGNYTGGLNDRSSPVQIGSAGYYSIPQAGNDAQSAITARQDYGLWVWGLNNYGQLGDGTTVSRSSPVQVTGLTDSGWIGNGANSELTSHMIKVDNTLWGWGYNGSGNIGNNTTINKSSPVQIGGSATWIQVSEAGDSVFAIRIPGTLWAWGANTYGQLGQGDTSSRSSPTQVGGLDDWYQVNSGGAFFIAVKTNGTLWSCGLNNAGQLGDGTKTDRLSPVQIGALTTWAFASIGGSSFGIRTDGTLWAWGDNTYGNLGLNSTISYSSPVQVGAATNWAAIYSGGDYNVIALTTDGKIYAWGRAVNYSNGNPSNANVSSPVQIGSATNWGDVRATKKGVYLVTTTGAVYGFGGNGSYNFGTGTIQLNRYSSPIQIGSSATWSYLALGNNYSIGINSGGLYAWGENSTGNLGDSTVINRSSPVQIGAGTDWSFVSASESRATFGIKTGKTLWAWGANPNGELGLSDINYRSSPTQVGALTNWDKVVSGASGSVGLKTDKTIWFVGGLNEYGVDGRNELTTTARSSPVQIGALTTWSKIAIGNYHVLATKTDGTLWSWGYNGHGQLGQNDVVNRSSPVQIGALTTWSYVGCGSNDSFAVKSDGTLWAWGYNLTGSLGDGTVINRSSPVQIGLLTDWGSIISGQTNQHTVTVKATGTAWSWGLNNGGQLGDGTTVNKSSPVQIGADTTWKFVAAGSATTGFQGGIK